MAKRTWDVRYVVATSIVELADEVAKFDLENDGDWVVGSTFTLKAPAAITDQTGIKEQIIQTMFKRA